MLQTQGISEYTSSWGVLKNALNYIHDFQIILWASFTYSSFAFGTIHAEIK